MDVSRELNNKSINLFAVTSDTTGDMNKFGEKLEAESVFHCSCSDYLLHLLTANKCNSGKSQSFIPFVHIIYFIWQLTNVIPQVMLLQIQSSRKSQSLHPLPINQHNWWQLYWMLRQDPNTTKAKGLSDAFCLQVMQIVMCACVLVHTQRLNGNFFLNFFPCSFGLYIHLLNKKTWEKHKNVLYKHI